MEVLLQYGIWSGGYAFLERGSNDQNPTFRPPARRLASQPELASPGEARLVRHHARQQVQDLLEHYRYLASPIHIDSCALSGSVC